MGLEKIRIFWITSPYFRGAVWKTSAYLCFAAINGIVRYLSSSSSVPLPAYEVAFFQNLLGLIFLLPWISQNGPSSLRTQLPLLQGMRIALSAVGIVLWYLSLQYMPLSQAVALMFLGPMFTVLGARIFLKENLSRERMLAILIGFFGGMIVSQTTFAKGMVNGYALLPVLAASCFSGATLMIRRLSQEDSPPLIVVYLLVFTAPILGIPTLLYGVWPEPWQWPWLFMMGGCAAGAHLCLGKAFSTAEVTYLVPFGFTKWFASTLIGFIAFAEIPSFETCIGSFILMAAILLLSYRSARRHQLVSA